MSEEKKERMLGYSLSEKIPLDTLKNVSGGNNKNGTKNVSIEYTNINASDTKVLMTYDW